MAEHTFLATFIGYVLGQMQPAADQSRLLQMCLVHDLPETRTGDLNYVQKKYLTVAHDKAVADLTEKIPFGEALISLLEEFAAALTLEARLAHDADQLALVVELKALQDVGNKGPEAWLPHVMGRLRTEAARELARQVLATPSDAWWFGHDREAPDDL